MKFNKDELEKAITCILVKLAFEEKLLSPKKGKEAPHVMSDLAELANHIATGLEKVGRVDDE